MWRKTTLLCTTAFATCLATQFSRLTLVTASRCCVGRNSVSAPHCRGLQHWGDCLAFYHSLGVCTGSDGGHPAVCLSSSLSSTRLHAGAGCCIHHTPPSQSSCVSEAATDQLSCNDIHTQLLCMRHALSAPCWDGIPWWQTLLLPKQPQNYSRHTGCKTCCPRHVSKNGTIPSQYTTYTAQPTQELSWVTQAAKSIDPHGSHTHTQNCRPARETQLQLSPRTAHPS